tara:strand:+ start:328 stop:576 length:249 start_codon:yes stop_codon:yes gene_type:complete
LYFTTVDVLHHFHLVRESDVSVLVGDQTVTSSYARNDFLKDMNAILGSESTYSKDFETKEIDAEAAYPNAKAMMVDVQGFVL